MTRLTWINEIVLKWNPGDIVEEYDTYTEKWIPHAKGTQVSVDPVGLTPKIDNEMRKYRIKPKLAEFVVWFNADTDFAFISAVLATSGVLDSHLDIVKGIRHAAEVKK